MMPGLIRNSHCFFMSLNLPLVKWRISLGHPLTPPVSVANLQTSDCLRCQAAKYLCLTDSTDCPPTPQSLSVFLSFYNLMLSLSLSLGSYSLGPHEYSPVSSHGTAARAGNFSQLQSSTIKYNKSGWTWDKTKPSLIFTSSLIFS